MTTMTRPTVDETRARVARAFTDDGVTLDAVHAVLEHVGDGPTVAAWSHAVHAAARFGTGGSVRMWARSHQGQAVSVLQVRSSGSAWMPGPRTLDASHATYATLDGSRREYAGTRVVAMTADTVAFLADNGETVVVWTVAA